MSRQPAEPVLQTNVSWAETQSPGESKCLGWTDGSINCREILTPLWVRGKNNVGSPLAHTGASSCSSGNWKETNTYLCIYIPNILFNTFTIFNKTIKNEEKCLVFFSLIRNSNSNSFVFPFCLRMVLSFLVGSEVRAWVSFVKRKEACPDCRLTFLRRIYLYF